MLWDIRFKAEDDRIKFEKEYKHYIDKVMVDSNSYSGGFGAWAMTRDIVRDVVYFVGYVGYAELNEILRECKKKKIRILFAADFPINDRMGEWEKKKGRHYA